MGEKPSDFSCVSERESEEGYIGKISFSEVDVKAFLKGVENKVNVEKGAFYVEAPGKVVFFKEHNLEIGKKICREFFYGLRFLFCLGLNLRFILRIRTYILKLRMEWC